MKFSLKRTPYDYIFLMGKRVKCYKETPSVADCAADEICRIWRKIKKVFK